jgi:hypothetical protein
MHFLHLLLPAAATAICCGCLAPAAQPVATSEPESSGPPATVVQPDPNAVRAMSFDDLDLKMNPDTLFEDWMLTQRVRDLDGKRVRITGFMLPSYDSQKIRHFIMLREKECPYGPGGQAHHVIAVTMKEASARFTAGSITVEGVLSVRPFTGYNDKTWAVYALDDAVLQ